MDLKHVSFFYNCVCYSTESDAEVVYPTCKLLIKRGLAQSKDNIDHPKFVVFVAGSAADPQPLQNELSKRFARDLDHNRIVHFSSVLKKWVYNDGTFHSGCHLEFPAPWLPPGCQAQRVLEAEL